MTQTQMGELLERATADLRPSHDLVAAALSDGRRRRRRSLTLTAVGPIAAAGVVAGALVALPHGSTGDRTVVADHPTRGTGGTSFAAQPSTGPATQPAAGDGAFPVAAEAMASTLATLVHGAVANQSNDQYRLSAPDGWQSGGVDLDRGSVSVSYEHSHGPRCDGDETRGNTGCTALGGGFFISTYTAEITTKGEGLTGVHDIGVTYYTPDGYKINATASNAGSADPTHPSMDHPVLDIAALTAIAEDPAWR